MTEILHLITEAGWRALPREGPWAPESLGSEGFVHCTGDDALMLVVANRFYAEVPGPVVVLCLDADRIGSEVRWEAASHPDGSAAGPDEPRFPHVYGPFDVGAIVGVRRLVRDGAGRFVGYEPVTGATA